MRGGSFDPPRSRRRRGAALFLVLAISAVPCACTSGTPPPNVVLITLDTTRADHLGCYGARGVETPNLDAMAESGARFETAITPVPITLPSHATILTGLAPAAHGVHDNVLHRLPDDVPTLATILKERGYDTAGFIAAAVLDHRFGLSRGFDHYDDDLLASMKERSAFSFVERRAEDVTRAALLWLGDKPRERPFFLWVHYFDPHQDYSAPPPFGDKYAARPYDGEIAYVDHWIGELLSGVAKSGAGRPTFAVAVGDHGEGLGEHGEQSHGLFLYDSTLHVPLLMSWPGRIPAGVSTAQAVNTEEILPTVLDLLAIAPPAPVKARSLAPLLRGERSAPEPIFLETMLPKNLFGWTPIEGVRLPAMKYVESPNPELYDLEHDPRESTNLAAERIDDARELAGRLSSHRQVAAAPRQGSRVGQLDETTRQRMAALGYAVTPEQGGSLEKSDPKDLVALYDSLYGGFALMAAQQWDEAIALFESVLRLHPRHVGTMVYLGEAYWRRALHGATIVTGAPTQSAAGGDSLLPLNLADNAAQDLEKAADWYGRALVVDPVSQQANLGLGRVLAHRGDLGAAVDRYRRALAVAPNDPDVQNEMAVIVIRQGRMDEALAQLEGLVKAQPDFAPAHRNLGALYRARGERERALEEYRLAARLAPSDRATLFLLARLLAEMNYLDQAVDNYRAVLTGDENDVQSRLGLGDVYLRKGDHGAARREFETAVRLAPELADGYFALGSVDVAEGKLDDAERNYRLALRYQPGLYAAEVRLALLYRQRAKNDLAIEALRRARTIAPQDRQVEELLARLEGEKSSTADKERGRELEQ